MPSGRKSAPERVGEYVVKGVIGEGGMGVVYEGVQPVIGKRVAIKLLKKDFAQDPEEAHRLVEEARSVNQIGHRGIVDIFSFGTLPDGRQYFVMEYLLGLPLSQYIRENAPLLPQDLLQIVDEIAVALGAAHNAGVIHRDLKPSNVFLVAQPDGTSYVKLLDFGLAKQALFARGETPQTRTSRVLGTPEFMAPEQARAEPVGPRTDLYALGVITYEMLTGRLPFVADTPYEVVNMHLNVLPQPPSALEPSVPGALDQLVLKLLEKLPHERPPNAELVRQEIKRIRKVLSLDATRLLTPVVPLEPMPAKRRPAPPSPGSDDFTWTPQAQKWPQNPVPIQEELTVVPRAMADELTVVPRATADVAQAMPDEEAEVTSPNVRLSSASGPHIASQATGSPQSSPVWPAPSGESRPMEAGEYLDSTALVVPMPVSTLSSAPTPSFGRALKVMVVVVFMLSVGVVAFVLGQLGGLREAQESADLPQETEPVAAAAPEGPSQAEPMPPEPEPPPPPQQPTSPEPTPPQTPEPPMPGAEAAEAKKAGGGKVKGAEPAKASAVCARYRRVKAAWSKARPTRSPEDQRIFDLMLSAIAKRACTTNEADAKEQLDDFVQSALPDQAL